MATKVLALEEGRIITMIIKKNLRQEIKNKMKIFKVITTTKVQEGAGNITTRTETMARTKAMVEETTLEKTRKIRRRTLMRIKLMREERGDRWILATTE
jgi:hypothetical protein